MMLPKNRRYQTIKCFLSDKAYYFSDGHILSRYFCANSDDPLWSVYSEYQQQYLMLLDAMRHLRQEHVLNLIIYNPSRIIEELNGEITPLNEWSKGVLKYLSRNVFPYFVDVSFKKMSATGVAKALDDGQREIDSYDVPAIDLVKSMEDMRKRRLDRFKNA